MPPGLIPGPGGKAAYEIACPGKGSRLLIRRFIPGEEGLPAEVQQIVDHPLAEKATLAGTPAIGPGGILVPLSNGTLLRFDLDGTLIKGSPRWREETANPDIRTHVVWLNAEEFLTTDGSRGLTRYHWPRDKRNWSLVPEKGGSENEPTIELTSRIVATPIVLPIEPEQAPIRVCVPTADNSIMLLEGQDVPAARKLGEGLKVKARWDVEGKITGSLALRGQQLLGVVDHRRLVCIDLTKPNPIWVHTAAQAIVGQPQFVEDMLIVADQSGRFVGVDPASGKAINPGLKLESSVAPAASPVAFGPGQAFAPLTDGTILLLPLDRLRKPIP
jgi:hypothetical protein